MSISADEVNFLVYRYLQENEVDLTPGALITFLQKGLEYIAIEENITEDGTIREFDINYSLLSPFICDAIANKDDRRVRRRVDSEANNNPEDPANEVATDTSRAGGVSSKEDVSEQSLVVPTSSSSMITLKNENDVKQLNLTGHQGEVFMCVWNPLKLQLASGSADGMCRLWDMGDMTTEKWSLPETTALKVRSCVMPHASSLGERFKDITSISWSPDGKFLATGCYTGEARIWDNKGSLKVILKEHTGPVFSLKWNKTGNFLLSGSYDRRTIVWAPETGAMVRNYGVHVQPVLDVDWRDSDTFASCSSDMSINVCSLSSAQSDPVYIFKGHTDEVNAICWSPGGLYLASCSDDTTAKIWSTSVGLVHTLTGHSKEIFTLRWAQTGPHTNFPHMPLMLCSASFDGMVKVWDPERGVLLHSLGRHSQPVYSVSPSPLGPVVATGSLGGHVSIWSLLDGALMHEMKGPGDTFDVSWSFDGALLSACFSSGSLIVQDAFLFKKFVELTTAAISSQEAITTSTILSQAVKAVASSIQITAGSILTGHADSDGQTQEIIIPSVSVTGAKTAAASAKISSSVAKLATKELPKELSRVSLQTGKSSTATASMKALSELRDITESTSGSTQLSVEESSLRTSTSKDSASAVNHSQIIATGDDSTAMVVEALRPPSHTKPSEVTPIKIAHGISSVINNSTASIDRNGNYFTTDPSMEVAFESTNEAIIEPPSTAPSILLEPISHTMESIETEAVSENAVEAITSTDEGVMEVSDQTAN